MVDRKQVEKEVAALIHDWFYVNCTGQLPLKRSIADLVMKYAATNQTDTPSNQELPHSTT
jgi:hypothetical protein